MPNIKILKKIENDYGWQITVQVSDKDSTTEHLVIIPLTTYEKLTGGKGEVDELVIKSFEFLLSKESKESILQEFEIDVIGTYFFKWEKEMVKQLS